MSTQTLPAKVGLMSSAYENSLDFFNPASLPRNYVVFGLNYLLLIDGIDNQCNNQVWITFGCH